MGKIGIMLLLLAMMISACNLSDNPPVTSFPPTENFAAETPVPSPALTPLGPTPLPALGSSSNPALGTVCDVFTTYSGTDPRNVLSMRAEPSANATLVIRVPTNNPVYRVPDSQEVEAEGFRWLNVIYVDPSQNRYTGWIARDSYIQSGVRNPSISTLRPTGQQAPC